MSENNTIHPGLTPDHAEYLSSHAIDIDLAVSLGVRSLTSREHTADMGGMWDNFINFPAIAFPWTNEAGRVEWQVRPDNPTKDIKTGRPRKYVFHKSMTPVLWAVRTVRNPRAVVIIEGTKQALAGASHAPADVSVYAISGCRSWQHEGRPIADLEIVEGQDVVVILDADAAENPQVFKAGIEMERALLMEGANKVLFGRLSAGGTSGLDDVLAARSPGRRAGYMARLITSAKAKPADKAPARKPGPGADGPAESERVRVVVNEDRHKVINNLCQAMLDRWNAKRLFNHGGVISRLMGNAMSPVDKGAFNDLVQATAETVSRIENEQGTTYKHTWPDTQTMAATMSRADHFATLDRISHSPFVRPDGSIAGEAGYDKRTRTMLVPDPVFDGIEVPDSPTEQQVEAARELLLTEWLGDFPLDGEADRANLLALILTPAIRGMVPRAPMAVIDGLQMGVGKNLLADSILTVYTGHAAEPMNWVDEGEELRKQITSAFRTGAEFFVFDEAHVLEGTALAQALTAETWQDRILGVSTMAAFPNRVTWLSLGNNVTVKGDVTRRVYRIALRPRYANPQDRPASSFRHPGTSGLDLGSWTRAHRRELMTAILTLVRAWFDRGQPTSRRGVSFGSFEQWERIVGGIVETAGVEGFLGNLKVWRSESDFDGQYWENHLRWLRDQFGDTPFKTGQVKAKAYDAMESYMAPPRLDDPTDKAYGKHLGESYSRIRDRRFGNLWLERVGSSHGHVSLWKVNELEEMPPADGGGGGSSPTGPAPTGSDSEVSNRCGCSRVMPVYCHAENCQGGADIEPDITQGVDNAVKNVQAGEVMTSKMDVPEDEIPLPDPAPYNEHGEARGADESDTFGGWADSEDSLEAALLTFDLETGDAGDLYKADPKTYVRIGATAADDREVTAYTEATAWNVTRDLLAYRDRATITGHNIMAFDLPALVRSGNLTFSDIHEWAKDGVLFDALLAARYVDPPMARDKGVDAQRKYDLGTLGVTYGLGEKLSDVSKALAKKHGGWANIPIDDSEDGRDFRAYMVQDVELSRRLHAALLERLGGTVPEYLVREHRIAAIAAQISHNGFLVDVPELEHRVTAVNERKSESLAWLAENAGLPLVDAKGNPYKSPLSSKTGKEAIGAALVEAGMKESSLWRTPKSGDLQLSGEAMLHYSREYQHSPQIRRIAKEVFRIVGARSVYQTAYDNLCPDGRVHPKIGFEQATGRWSVTSPGLTVFGKRGGRHVEREVFLPEPGHVIISADLSQVDMRAVAGLSQDQAYIRMLESDDPHSELAIALFGDVKFREQAKAIGHGWNYGESLRRISEENEIDPALVRKFDTSMRERFPRLVEWRDEVRAIGETGALLDNGFGRKMRPDPRRSHTQSPALLGQGAARDLMMEGLLRMPSELYPLLRGVVHDEVLLSVPEADHVEIGRVVVEALSFTWKGVPILADVSKPGRTWGGCYAK